MCWNTENFVTILNLVFHQTSATQKYCLCVFAYDGEKLSSKPLKSPRTSIEKQQLKPRHPLHTSCVVCHIIIAGCKWQQFPKAAIVANPQTVCGTQLSDFKQTIQSKTSQLFQLLAGILKPGKQKRKRIWLSKPLLASPSRFKLHSFIYMGTSKYLQSPF